MREKPEEQEINPLLGQGRDSALEKGGNPFVL